MAQLSVKRQRLDPYKNFKFRLKWDGEYVAGMNKLTVGLTRTSEVVQHRQGGDPSTSRKSPGRTKYEAVTLEQGDHPRHRISELGQQRMGFWWRTRVGDIAEEFPQGPHSGVL